MQPHRREFLRQTIAAGLAVGASSAWAENQQDAKQPIVDCHTHFYDPARPEGVPWPGKNDAVLYRTVLPPDFLKQAEPVGVTKTVVVEASPWVEDNAWLLELAIKQPSILGVVGNLKPGEPEFANHLQRFTANPIFRGIRVNHNAVRAGLEKPEFLADLRRLADANLELDVNGGPETPADVARLAAKIPELRIVINHLANVTVDGKQPPAMWLAGMQAAAKHPRVFCKVSALVEHARPSSGDTTPPDDVEFYRPILDAIWNTFGDDRLIYGSNWPVSERFASYAKVFAIVKQYVAARGASATDKFFWKNAVSAYQWQT